MISPGLNWRRPSASRIVSVTAAVGAGCSITRGARSSRAELNIEPPALDTDCRLPASRFPLPARVLGPTCERSEPRSSADTRAQRAAVSYRLRPPEMSEDEVVVTVVSLFVGPLLWLFWLLSLRRVTPLRPGRRGTVLVLTVALSACAVFILAIL